MLLQIAAALALAQDQRIEFDVREVDASKPWRMISVDDKKEIPAQIRDGKVAFFGSNNKEEYRLEPGAPASFPAVECADDGKSLTIHVGDKKVLQYHHAPVAQPDPLFTRSGYIHPVWTPSGKIVTNDSPPNHLHHHGIWAAWTSSEFEGRKSNFWESAAKQGRVECVKVEEIFSGPVFGGFKARHRYVNLNGPDGPKTALEETWEIRVYAQSDRFLFDLTSVQTAATDQPLVIKEYRYGGVGFRGSKDWEGKAGLEFLTSEGKNRVDGHATKAKWVVATGKVDGKETSVGFIGHLRNFRDPQPLRIHPDEPFFNWAVPQGGDFSIEPGKPYVSRYQFVVADGRLDHGPMERAWAQFNAVPTCRLTIAK